VQHDPKNHLTATAFRVIHFGVTENLNLRLLLGALLSGGVAVEV
jgi:hypothetical protein